MTSYRSDFPVYDKFPDLAYLDSAASTQKVRPVLDVMMRSYSERYANVHRGIYHLSELATTDYENARKRVGDFFNVSANSIVFVKGATEGINLVAESFTRLRLQAGDEIILSQMEHHANIVPWYRLCEQTGAKLKVIGLNERGELDLEAYRAAFSARTKMVALTHVSNVLGTVNPAEKLCVIAKEHQVPILIDGAQAASHIPVDIKALDPDFYTASAHKMYGPTGIGVLYIKPEHMAQMSPYQSGGSMIESVAFEQITYMHGPMKFEAGTPHSAGAIGLSVACDYIKSVSFSRIVSHEQALLKLLEDGLQKISGLRVYGQAPNKIGVVSFALEGVHPHDIATLLDHEQVAVRAGHHCAMPLVRSFDEPALTRISLGLNNTEQDVIQAIAALQKVREMFK